MTKERLQELIEQGVSVWGVKEIDCYGEQLGICEAVKINEDNIDLESLEEKGRVIFLSNDYFGEVYEYEIHLGCIYETEKRALHHAKYGNITRTETMPVPPTWEDLKGVDRDWSVRCIDCELGMSVSFGKVTMAKWYAGNECEEIIYKADLTQQNYNLALDKMVQLFKGE